MSNTPEPSIQWVDYTSHGVGRQLFLPSSVVPCWPTCGSAAVCVPFALGGLLSGEIITLPAPSPLNRHSFCSCVCVSMCIYQSECWSGLQSLSTNEQIKHQLNGNRNAALSINVQPFSPTGSLIRCIHNRSICFRLFLNTMSLEASKSSPFFLFFSVAVCVVIVYRSCRGLLSCSGPQTRCKPSQ